MNMQAGAPRDEVNLGDDFVADAMKAAESAKAQPGIDTMVKATSIWLQGFVAKIREFETQIEARKRRSAEKYEAAVAAAKAERDREDAANDARLLQLRRTFEVMDPARAKLAEIA